MDLTYNDLKSAQRRAYDIIFPRLLAGHPLTKLTGYAGTGKTVELGVIARDLRRRGVENVTLAAPTHKAVGVLSEKMGAIGYDVRTIYSLLGLKLSADMENDTGEHILRAGTSEASGIVICDEASMVGSELRAQIDKQDGVIWLFCGDPAQLPPVGESRSDLLEDPDATLDEVLRQRGDSEILDLATDIRNGKIDFSTRQFGRDVTAVADPDRLFDAARVRFEDPAWEQDSTFARMLVFRNARRRAINDTMRKLLVGSDHPYVDGEWLVMYQQYSITGARMEEIAAEARVLPKGRRRSQLWAEFWALKESAPRVLHTSQEVRVENVGEEVLDAGGEQWPVWLLDITTYGDRHQLRVLHHDHRDRWVQARNAIAAEGRDVKAERDKHSPTSYQWAEIERQRKSLWIRFYALESTFAWVDYSYAMTVHKSQGSTFSHAFVDLPDITRSGGMRQSLAYTAVTRPSETLTFNRC